MKNQLLTLSLATNLAARPAKLIFDTDMGNDINDAQALAMIHALKNRGLVELLAVTPTKNHPRPRSLHPTLPRPAEEVI